MSANFEITFDSWGKVAQAFDEASAGAAGALSDVVSQTTNAGACGADKGYATVDGAVAVMLTVFGEVMRTQVVESLRTGLAGEALSLAETGQLLRDMEDTNTARSGEIRGAL